MLSQFKLYFLNVYLCVFCSLFEIFDSLGINLEFG